MVSLHTALSLTDQPPVAATTNISCNSALLELLKLFAVYFSVDELVTGSSGVGRSVMQYLKTSHLKKSSSFLL
jgi:hypothetical protein